MTLAQLLPDRSGSQPAATIADESDAVLGDVCRICKNDRRRAVIRILGESEHEQTSIEQGTLAELVAARQYGATPETLGSQRRKRVYIALIQVHLPKLVEADVVEWERDLVSCGPAFETYANALSVLEEAIDR